MTVLLDKIKDRPRVWPLRHVVFNLFFFVYMMSIFFLQLFLLPLYCIPILRHKVVFPIWDSTKDLTGKGLCLISHWFAPSSIRLTVHEGGQLMEEIVNMKDGAKKLNLPRQNVLISNHQIYVDWVYLCKLLVFVVTRALYRENRVTFTLCQSLIFACHHPQSLTTLGTACRSMHAVLSLYLHFEIMGS